LRRAISAGAHDEGFEDLKAAFCARLQNERVRFVTLSAALARAEDDPGRIFHDLSARAHKIRGGAALVRILGTLDSGDRAIMAALTR
jgi:hypothetical protein